MNPDTINNPDMAFRYVLGFVNKKYNTFFSIRYANKGRHAMLFPPPLDSDFTLPSFYVLFKREYFVKFNNYFPDFVKNNPAMAGYGESINVDSLNFAIKHSMQFIVFVHPDKSMYRMNALTIRNFCHRFNLVRHQKKLNDYMMPNHNGFHSVSEKTYCVPLKLLHNFEEAMKIEH